MPVDQDRPLPFAGYERAKWLHQGTLQTCISKNWVIIRKPINSVYTDYLG